ncbi:hypothetical protein O159_04880 [Leifsonia xyli subsp. cynodontis DSM 46306]|uniref:Uncharacterized protein n=1 Tax=Leifsonia xyli subsp. cynodontis DSM 46306 TaxID=1389489 RepID=U3P5D9_LEIXC|nr:hypothetical protein O159_04880 [Leifsonia xyli subsp. cynodontis DSM 46306]
MLVGRRSLPAVGGGQAGAGSGTASARSEDLRLYRAQAGSLDLELAGALSRVRRALEDVAAGCRWGRIDGSGVVAGFQRWIEQNQADGSWLEGAAGAFETAGSGVALGSTVWAFFGVPESGASPLSAVELLALLKETTPAELRRLLAADAGLAQLFWNAPPAPASTAAWWAGLDQGQRDAFVVQAPIVIGNLPGLPYAVRNAANLKQYVYWQQHRESLNDDQRRALDALAGVLRSPIKGMPVQLVALNLFASVPLLAVGYGNLDAVTNTTWCVPGMGTDAADGTNAWSTAARNLYAVQSRLPGMVPGVIRVARLRHSGPGHGHRK